MKIKNIIINLVIALCCYGCSSPTNTITKNEVTSTNSMFSGNAKIIATAQVSNSVYQQVRPSSTTFTPLSVEPQENKPVKKIQIPLEGAIAKLYAINKNGTETYTNLQTTVNKNGVLEFDNIKEQQLFSIKYTFVGDNNKALKFEAIINTSEGEVSITHNEKSNLIKLIFLTYFGDQLAQTESLSPKQGKKIIDMCIQSSHQAIDTILESEEKELKPENYVKIGNIYIGEFNQENKNKMDSIVQKINSRQIE